MNSMGADNPKNARCSTHFVRTSKVLVHQVPPETVSVLINNLDFLTQFLIYARCSSILEFSYIQKDVTHLEQLSTKLPPLILLMKGFY